jgi:glycosyltransferase involved in cell wall biosynthesis
MNFAASHSGGGFKRLYEFAKWFDANGGAWFIIHPKSASLRDEFPRNKFWIADQPRYQRLLNDCSYLTAVEKEIGLPQLYYSYGIPIYRKIGTKNWFHLSNVLPLASREVPLSMFDRVKLRYLGRRIRENLHNADVISAESHYSLSLIDGAQREKLVLSVNGSDEELAYLRQSGPQPNANIATVVGTYRYKDLEDSYRVFEMLRQANDGLRLVIIGNLRYVPSALRRNDSVELKGVLKRHDVIQNLRKSKFYISTTHIENSFNAASEGVVFAQESFISDIGPHRELLVDTPFKTVWIPGIKRPILHVARSNVSGANLQSWHDIISDMVAKVRDGNMKPVHASAPKLP